MNGYDRQSEYWRDIEEAQEAQIKAQKDLANKSEHDQERDRKSDK